MDIILASASPRRKDLLKQMGFEFKVSPLDIDESWPQNITWQDIPEFLAKKKSKSISHIAKNEIWITADTMVFLNENAIGKPKDKEQAIEFLKLLSGKTHTVISGVCIRAKSSLISFSERSEVEFTQLKMHAINHYVNNFNPYDKAGGYGVQDWIGSIGIHKINGSYTNVLGLPTARLYKELGKLLNR